MTTVITGQTDPDESGRPKKSRKKFGLDSASLDAWAAAKLAALRPDGEYSAGDCDWRIPLYEEIASMIPADEACRLAAKQFVDQIEGRATRGANEALRWIGKHGAWPATWDNLVEGRYPLSMKKKRIVLENASADHLMTWASEERRRAGQEYTAREAACTGAEWMAVQMRKRKWKTVAEAIRGTRS